MLFMGDVHDLLTILWIGLEFLESDYAFSRLVCTTMYPRDVSLLDLFLFQDVLEATCGLVNGNYTK